MTGDLLRRGTAFRFRQPKIYTKHVVEDVVPSASGSDWDMIYYRGIEPYRGSLQNMRRMKLETIYKVIV